MGCRKYTGFKEIFKLDFEVVSVVQQAGNDKVYYQKKDTSKMEKNELQNNFKSVNFSFNENSE